MTLKSPKSLIQKTERCTIRRADGRKLNAGFLDPREAALGAFDLRSQPAHRG
jgi:hypothetical protein